VPSPSPSSAGNALSGVAAISATDAWAVGYTIDKGDVKHTLIEHWNGKAWERVSSPDPGGAAELDGVAAAGATNIWAVGLVDLSALALHCC